MTKLRDKRLFLLDMDGTLYIGDRLFDGVPEFLRHVRSMGGRYLFLTNNSSRGVEGYIEKLRRLGIESAPGDYLTSVDATIRYLKAALPGKSCPSWTGPGSPSPGTGSRRRCFCAASTRS